MFAARTASVNHSVTNGVGPLCSCVRNCGNSRVTSRLGVRSGRSVRGRTTRHISYFAAMDRVASHRYTRLLRGGTSIVAIGNFRSSFMPGNTTFATGHGRTHGIVLGMTDGLLNRRFTSSAVVMSANNHCRFHGGKVSVLLRSLGHLTRRPSLGHSMLTFVGIPT